MSGEHAGRVLSMGLRTNSTIVRTTQNQKSMLVPDHERAQNRVKE